MGTSWLRAKRAGYWVLALMLAGCGHAADTGKAPAAAEVTTANPPAAAPAGVDSPAERTGEPVALSIVDFDGIRQHIERNRGKVVVMDAWSTSCAPCVKEFHNLVELHRQYGPQEVACISLSFDYEGIGKPEEQQERVLNFLRGQHATIDNLLSNEESDVLYRKFKLAAIPAVFVYDRQGQLRKRFDNENAKSKSEAFTYEQVKQLVAELLTEKSAGEPGAAQPGAAQPGS